MRTYEFTAARSVKPFAKKYVIVNPETGATFYSEEHKSWSEYHDAEIAKKQAMPAARLQRNSDRFSEMIAAEMAKLNPVPQQVRKPLFDRRALVAKQIEAVRNAANPLTAAGF